MTDRGDRFFIGSVAFFAVCGIAAVGLSGVDRLIGGDAPGTQRPEPSVAPVVAARSDFTGVEWLHLVRDSCTPEGVDALAQLPAAPETDDGRAHRAACLALGGRIDEAREILDGMQDDARWRAAGVVFGVGHPVADQGNEMAAGPLMELVVEFWPNHYMALYHAGAARHARGDFAGARPFLQRFLAEYQQDDGWSENARIMVASSAGQIL